jgi:hypothetical protein
MNSGASAMSPLSGAAGAQRLLKIFARSAACASAAASDAELPHWPTERARCCQGRKIGLSGEGLRQAVASGFTALQLKGFADPKSQPIARQCYR